MTKLKALWSWLIESTEAKYYWTCLIFTCIAIGISFRSNTPENVIRLTGLFLQILGIFLVFTGISETRDFFGHKSLLRKVRAWFSRFPLKSRKIAITGTASIVETGDYASATGGHGLHSSESCSTIESRFDTIQKNILLLNELITQTHKDANDKFEKSKLLLQQETESRKTQDTIILQKIESVATGGFYLSEIGTVWLLVGAILSTAAIEIEKFNRGCKLAEIFSSGQCPAATNNSDTEKTKIIPHHSKILTI
jgi:hypothetical protein